MLGVQYLAASAGTGSVSMQFSPWLWFREGKDPYRGIDQNERSHSLVGAPKALKFFEIEAEIERAQLTDEIL